MASRKKKRNRGAHGNRGRPGFERNAKGEIEDGFEPARSSRRQFALNIVLAVCLIVGGVALAVYRPWTSPEDVPEPWEYDEVHDRHWHPSHGHWHDGPPPGRTQPTPIWGDLPEPWEYDPVNDRYWHPGHGHWHAGRPPAPEER